MTDLSNRIPQWPIATEREMALLREVIESPQWGGFNGIVQRFEREFAAFQHAAHGVSAMNGTVTLEMALSVLGIGRGDEVIVPAISFVSSATAVSRVGATPVFVDIEEPTFNIDPIRAAMALTPHTKAIMPVHFGGAMAQMDRLTELTGGFGIALLEDAAHAQGSEWNGKRAGSIGACGSFSFQNGKVMTAGEGGILITGDESLAEKFRSFANQGRKVDGPSNFHHFALGTNFRMTAMQAAILIAQLERLPDQIALRARNAAAIRKAAEDVPALRWQQAPAECTAQSYYLLLGRIANRDEFCRKLTEAGIPNTPFYPHTLYENPLYESRASCVVHDCPVSEDSIHDAFWLPHRVLMADEETTARIGQAIREAALGAA